MKKLNLTPKDLKQVDDWVDKRVIPTEPQVTKKLTVRISADLHKRFKQKALADDVSMDKVVSYLLEAWCNEAANTKD